MKRVLLVLSAIFAVTFATQCDVIDLSTYNTEAWAYNSDIDQSFTSTVNGYLSSIKIYVMSADTCRRDAYEDERACKRSQIPLTMTVKSGVTTLGSNEINVENNYAAYQTFTFNIPVTASTTYNFIVTSTNNMVDIAAALSTTSYPLGQLAINSAEDLYFVATFDCASSSGDPHFYGFKGQKYDVMGQSFEIYNIITSPYLQINSKFTPYYKTAEQSTPTGTMLGELGIKFYSQQLYINSNSTIAILNESPISLETDWTLSFDNGITLKNEILGRMYLFTIQTEDVMITFARKVYMVSGVEPQWHYDYKARFLQSNHEFHGLLGQTWEYKVFEDKSGAFKYLDGSEGDYHVKSGNIFGDEFKYNKFQNF